MLALSERALQQAVTDLCRLRRLPCYHTYDSRRSAAGFPDLVIVRGDELIVRELKSERGRVGSAQALWLEALREVTCVSVGVWRPSDWRDGIIDMALCERR